MSVNRRRYRAPHASERLLPRTLKGLYNGCRVAVTWMALAYASLGESTLMQDGRRKDRRAITASLKRMRDATGEPERDSFNQTHVPALAGAIGYEPSPPFRGSTAEMLADTDAAYSIAGNVKSMAGTKLRSLAEQRGWAGADHELLLTPHRRNGMALIMDPMAPQAGYRGDWIPLDEVRRFVKPFDLVAERWGLGSQTAAADAERQRDRLRGERDAERVKVRDLRTEVKALREGQDDVVRAEVITQLKKLVDELEAA